MRAIIIAGPSHNNANLWLHSKTSFCEPDYAESAPNRRMFFKETTDPTYASSRACPGKFVSS